MSKVILYASAGVSMLLAGCATNDVEEASHAASDIRDNAQSSLDAHTRISSSATRVEFRDDDYLVGSKFRVESRRSIPSFFRDIYSFNRVDPIPLSELISYINKETNLRIHLTHDAIKYIEEMEDRAEELDFDSSDLFAPQDDGNLISAGSEIVGEATSDRGRGISGASLLFTVNFEGDLESFLNHFLGRINLSWDWKGDHIEIYHVKEKTFTIDTDLSSMQYTAQISGGSGSSQDFTLSNVMGDMAESIESTLSELISDHGSFSLTNQYSILTVTDTPSNLRRIESFISQLNESASKKIMMRVEVFDIETNNAGDYGVEVDALFSGSSRLSAGFSSAGISSNTGNVFDFSPIGTGAWTDTAMAIRALSERNNVSTSINTTVHTTNGRPVPLRIGSESHYISRTINERDEDNRVTSGIETDMMETGFILNVLPRVTSSGEVAMTMGIDISDGLINQTTLPDGTDVGLPVLNSRSFIQRAVAGNGQPLMLAGFEREQSKTTERSIGSGISWLLGGGKTSDHGKVMSIVIITPYLVK